MGETPGAGHWWRPELENSVKAQVGVTAPGRRSQELGLNPDSTPSSWRSQVSLVGQSKDQTGRCLVPRGCLSLPEPTPCPVRIGAVG